MNERSPFLTGATERDPNHVPFVTERENYTIATDAGTVIAQVSHVDIDDTEDEPEHLTEHDVAYTLADLLHGELIAAEQYDGPESAVRRIEHFEDAGLLTADKGLVITLANGQEFQITVTRSA